MQPLMGRKPIRPVPNTEDPLSEPTIARRLLAAFMRAGYTKTHVEKAIGVKWATVNNWDRNLFQPKLGTLMRAVQASPPIGFTLDELVFGREALSDEQVIELLDRLNASPDERDAFVRHLQTTSGKFARRDRSYIAGFVAALRSDALKGLDSQARSDAAARSADMAQQHEEHARKAGARRLKPRSTPPPPDDGPPTRQRRK